MKTEKIKIDVDYISHDLHYNLKINGFSHTPICAGSKPLWQHVTEWFRTQHRIDICVLPWKDLSGGIGYEYKIYSHGTFIKGSSYLIKKAGIKQVEVDDEAVTYYSVLKAGIEKAIEIIQ